MRHPDFLIPSTVWDITCHIDGRGILWDLSDDYGRHSVFANIDRAYAAVREAERNTERLWAEFFPAKTGAK